MSIWTDRDLPVLRALVEPADENLREGFIALTSSGLGAQALGVELDDFQVADSLLTLRDAGYVDFGDQGEAGGPGPNLMLTQLAIRGPGLQALGEWPLFEAISSPATLALLLEQLAPEAPTDEESSNLRRAAAYVRGVAPGVMRQLVVGAVTAAARAHLPHGV